MMSSNACQNNLEIFDLTKSIRFLVQVTNYFKDGCPNQTVCGHCSGHHQSENCSLVDTADISKLTCTNCKDSNMPDGGNGHSTFWYKCPAYMVAQKKLKSTIPYYDGETAIGHDLNQ